MDENRARGERLRVARKRAGLNVDQVAQRAGYSSSGVRAIENGQNGLRPDAAERFAPVLGVTAAWLLTGQGGDKASAVYVPIIGYVGADAEGRVQFADGQDTGDSAPIPPGGSPKARGLFVRGHSMKGVADDGALIFFEDQRTPPTPDMLGYPCIIETVGGQILVKRLLKGTEPGLYDLESVNGPTLPDVRLVWAAEITAIIPPRQARRIVRGVGEDA